jgi:hypothetical protein
MAVTSTSVVTFERRVMTSEDSSSTSYALYKITTTTTVKTAPDTPEGTTVAVSEEFLSVDYTAIYSEISNHLSGIKTTLHNVETLAAGDGIKTMNVYDWVMLASMYKLYVDDDTDYKIGLEELVSYISKVRDLPKL